MPSRAAICRSDQLSPTKPARRCTGEQLTAHAVELPDMAEDEAAQGGAGVEGGW